MRPEIQLELQRMLSALCDGELAEGEFSRLGVLLRADPESRRVYLEYMDLHGALLLNAQAGGALPSSSDDAGTACVAPETPETKAIVASVPVLSVNFLQPRFSMVRTLRYVMVAASALAASFLVQIFWSPPQSFPGSAVVAPVAIESRANETKAETTIATLRRAVDCIWDSPRKKWQTGSRLPAGEFRLLKGIATIDFDSGSELVVEGPAVLRFDSSSAVAVLSGKVVFRADDSAGPFDLHTPTSTLADLDTEYAVSVTKETEEVHVFEGIVHRQANLATKDDEPEQLKAGEARRYELARANSGKPTAFDPARFVRHVEIPEQAGPGNKTGLLAYEGFDYRHPSMLTAGKANGGFGWTGPWQAGFTSPALEGNRPKPLLNIGQGLTRPEASIPAIGGSFDFNGFAKSWRRMAQPVRLDTDGVYYLSYLFRREDSAPHPVNAVGVLLWTDDDFRQKNYDDHRKRLSIGIKKSNQLHTQFQRMDAQAPVTVNNKTTYLLIAKIVASRANTDQILARVYGPTQPVENSEPASWPLRSAPFKSDLVFDWLQLQVNSKTRQTIDEIRVGTTWASVTAPWALSE